VRFGQGAILRYSSTPFADVASKMWTDI
jgi:hypothetical protein